MKNQQNTNYLVKHKADFSVKGLELLNIDIYVIFMQKDFSKQEYEDILGHNFSHGITGCEI